MIKVLLKRMNNPLMANSFYLYVAHFADYFFSILILPFIARILGPEELGNLVLAQTFGLFLLLIMEFGFSLTATREVAILKNKKEELANYIGKAFSFKFLLIPITIILCIIIINTFPIFKTKPYYIWIVMVGSLFQGLAPTWFFQGIERLKIVALSKVIFRAIGFIIILFFIKDKEDGWIILISYTITSSLIFIYLTNNILKIVGRIKLSKIKDLNVIWKKSRWVFLISIIPLIFQNSAAFLLSLTVAPFQLGLYFGATKIYRSFNTLYGPIGLAVYPKLVTSNIDDKNASKKLAKKLFYLLFTLGLVFCSLLLFLPNLFISFLLGNDFLDASRTLQLFGIVLPLTAISHVLGRQWMLVQGNEREYAIILLCALLITIIFLSVSINTIGIQSVPISLIIFELTTILIILLNR